MRIELDDAKSGPIQWSETLHLDADTLESPEIVGLGPIEASGELALAEPNYRLKGSVAYDQTLSCYRCLEEFSAPVDSDFEYLLQRRTAPSNLDDDDSTESKDSSESFDSEVELEKADLEMLAVSAAHIDPLDYVREEVLLQVPMKALCRPDCKGLCPECGTDLNSQSCDCKTSETDPRWAGLESLKKSLDA